MSEEINFKHFRTYHFPFSLGKTSDDKVISDYSGLLNQEIVQTEKLDGENAVFTRSGYHARSINSIDKTDRLIAARWQARKWHREIGQYMINEDEIVIAENLAEIHSIEYFLPYPENMIYPVFIFSIIKNGMVLSWDQVKERASELSLMTVPEIYRGKFDLKIIQKGFNGKSLLGGDGKSLQEGYVVRTLDGFPATQDAYSSYVAKFVRANHVQSDEKHWAYKPTNSNFKKSGS